MARLIFIALSIYLFIRGFQALPKILFLRIVYAVIFCFATFSFYSGSFLSDLFPSNAVIFLRRIGGFWAIIFVFSLLAAFLADFLRILDQRFGVFPEWLHNHYPRVKLVYFSIVVVSLLIVSLVGFRKFDEARVKTHRISLNKSNVDFNDLSIVAASDFHLGNVVGKERLAEWIEMINALHPDIVLLAGDLFDRNFNKDMSSELSFEFRKLHAKFGVYAVLGNHEYYTNTEEALNCLKHSGIRLLKDEAITIENKLVVIGRDDYTNTQRKSLDSLLIDIDRNLPLILMDHQPVHLNQTVKENIDLQISGHLHNGQIYPLSLLLKSKWELYYGYRKTKNTHFFVTSGLGLRRIPIRLGSQSEIVKIIVNGKTEN